MNVRLWVIAAGAGVIWTEPPASSAAISQIVEQVVVQVNGDIITRTEIEARVRVAIAQERGQAVSQKDIRGDLQLRDRAEALAPRMVLDAVDELLLVQWARDRGLEASDADVDRVLARLRQENDVTTDEAFDALLIREGIPPDGLRQSVHRQISIEMVRRLESSRVSVRDEEARRYYRDHPEEFPVSPLVTFREILIRLPVIEESRPPADLVEQYDEGLIRLVRAQDRIIAGEDFSAVARAMSGAASREDGGAVGPVAITSLAKPLHDALMRLSVGQLSLPVRTGEGYFLLKVEQLVPAPPANFEAWREVVVARLLEVKRASALTARLNGLRSTALIRWRDHALEAACAVLRTPARLAP